MKHAPTATTTEQRRWMLIEIWGRSTSWAKRKEIDKHVDRQSARDSYGAVIDISDLPGAQGPRHE